MSWYYAENNDRKGPLEDAAFDELVRVGRITPATLVWREGMANWAPFSQAGYVVPEAETPPPVGGVEMGVCSESGRILPRSELVEIDGRLVSAEYKNIVLQRIREGVGTVGSASDPDTLMREVEARGYYISFRACIGRAFGLMKRHFWIMVGAIFLVMLISQAAGILPLVGPILVFGPLAGGSYWLMLKLHRGEPTGVGDAFVGFSRGFGELVAIGAIIFGVSLLCLLPAIAMVVFIAVTSGSEPPSTQLVFGMFGIGFLGALPIIYFWVSWIFSFLLVVDKGLGIGAALKVSRHAVGMHWWQVFKLLFLTALLIGAIVMGAMIFVGLLSGLAGLWGGGSQGAAMGGMFLGIILFVFGFIALLPLTYATVAIAYEDIFGGRRPE